MSAVSGRGRVLLQLAAAALEEQRDPFSRDFLVEHGVTADECFDLSSNIGLCIEMVLALPPAQRRMAELAWAAGALAKAARS